jgi:hypothetical protein
MLAPCLLANKPSFQFRARRNHLCSARCECDWPFQEHQDKFHLILLEDRGPSCLLHELGFRRSALKFRLVLETRRDHGSGRHAGVLVRAARQPAAVQEEEAVPDGGAQGPHGLRRLRDESPERPHQNERYYLPINRTGLY